MSNGLDPDQNRLSVGSDLGPNCLQSLSAYNIFADSQERVNELCSVCYYIKGIKMHKKIGNCNLVPLDIYNESFQVYCSKPGGIFHLYTQG